MYIDGDFFCIDIIILDLVLEMGIGFGGREFVI